MKLIKGIALLGAALSLSACMGEKNDKTVDRGFDSKHLSQLVAGVWVDPNGCQHWIIDDGVEGYLSARMDKYGKPICNDISPEGYAVGNYKAGSTIADTI